MEKKYHMLSSETYSKNIALTNILSFLAVLVLFLILFFAIPKKSVSEDEKRELAVLPKFSANTFFSGQFTKDLAIYYDDNFPFRETFIALSSQLEGMRGLRIDDVTIHTGPDVNLTASPIDPTTNNDNNSNNSNLPIVGSPSSTPQSSSQENNSNSSNQSNDENIVGEQQGSTFIYKNRAMAMFGCNNDMGSWYAEILNKYAKDLGDDVKIYNMVVPTSIDFYIPEKYKHITQPQKPAIDNIYSKLDPSIVKIDAYSQLEQHKDEYIYFNTDHHWTGLGAYYAYTAFAKQAGFEPVPISKFETRRLDNFLGTLYGQTKDLKLKNNPDFVDYYMIDTPHETYRYVKNAPYSQIPSTIHGEYAVSPNSYSVFLHGDFPLTRIDTNIKNGKKIAVVKESYGNAFSPFLANHYEQVFIIDERYFQLGFIDFIKQNGINELVFVNNTMAAYTPYHIKNIDKIMYQKFAYQTSAPVVTPSPTAPPPIAESKPIIEPTVIPVPTPEPTIAPIPTPTPEPKQNRAERDDE